MRRTLFAVAGAALFVYLSFVATIERYSRVDETQPAQAIVVLGAGVYADGTPSDAMRARIEHGLHLYEGDYAPLIAVSGGVRTRPPAEALVMADRMLVGGVPQDALIVERQSLNTLQNAEYVAPLLADRGVETILLVTSPFHQWRAERIFEAAGFEVYLSPPPDDPAELRPVHRPYYLAREGGVALMYVLFGPSSDSQTAGLHS